MISAMRARWRGTNLSFRIRYSAADRSIRHLRSCRLLLCQAFFRLDELDPLDPFHHLVAKLILNSQPQRCSIDLRKPLAVHLRGQQTLRLQHILHALRVVIGAAIERFAKRKERDDLGFRFRPHQLDERLHRNAAPFRDAAPSLDAMMHRDVFGLAQLLQIGKRKLDRIFDKAAHLKPEILESQFPPDASSRRGPAFFRWARSTARFPLRHTSAADQGGST